MKLVKRAAHFFTTFTVKQKLKTVDNSLNSIKELHAHLIRTHLHTDPSSIAEVIRSYALSPQCLHTADLVFNQIERPTLLVWNHMIRGKSQSDRPKEAIHAYALMRRQGLVGNHLSLIFVFKACGQVPDIGHGQMVHVHAIKVGFGSYLFVSNAMIHMYAFSGHLGYARKVFDGMGERDLISWNSLICGYSQCNKFKDLLGLFEKMQVANVQADAVTMMKVVLACSLLSEWRLADAMVKYIEENCILIDVYLGNTLIDMYGRRGLVDLAQGVFDRMRERNMVSWNTMIMGYGKIGNLVAAKRLFDDMPRKDVISWTSMITAYSQANQFPEAVSLFKEMMAAKVKPDEITVASVLSACAHIGSLDVGEAIHDYIRNHGVKQDIYVGNALIDMYCKCGEFQKALEVFKEMKKKDSVSWNSIISGLAVNGFTDSVLEIYSEMLKDGVQPTHGAFVGILLACVHAGLVDKGLEYFGSMEKDFGLKPEMKHYGCVVDLLGRSGNLERAYDFINKMPISPDVVLWRMLLHACMLHENVALAEITKKKLLELDPDNSGNYVLSSNTYAGSDRWDDVLKVRGLMEGNKVQKPSGNSSIEYTF